MIVCQCKAVRDYQVRTLVQQGSFTRAAVSRACGAGSDCGGCRPAIDEIIAEERYGCAAAAHDTDGTRSHHSARHAVQLSLVKSKRATAG